MEVDEESLHDINEESPIKNKGKRRSHSKTIGISRFGDSHIEEVQVDQIRCMPNKVCARFVMTSVVSILTLLFGLLVVVLYHDNEVLLMLGTNLISLNISLWIKPPSVESQANKTSTDD